MYICQNCTGSYVINDQPLCERVMASAIGMCLVIKEKMVLCAHDSEFVAYKYGVCISDKLCTDI